MTKQIPIDSSNIQSIFDSKIKEMLSSTYNSKPSAAEKASLSCCRCASLGPPELGVLDSHTIPKSILKGIANSKHKISSIGFTRDDKNQFKTTESSPTNTSTYPLFCSKCEKQYEIATEATVFDVESPAFINCCAMMCERLIFKGYYKAEKITTSLMDTWNKEQVGFEKLLTKYGLSTSNIQKNFIPFSARLNEIVQWKQSICESKTYSIDSALSWCHRILQGDESEFTLFIWIADKFPWRVGDLTFQKDSLENIRWFFIFSTRTLVEGKIKDAIVFIPVYLTGPPGSASTPEDYEKCKTFHNNLATDKVKMENFSNQAKLALSAYCLGKEDFFFEEDFTLKANKHIGKTMRERTDGSSILESMIIELFSKTPCVEKNLSTIGLKGYAINTSTQVGGSVRFKTTGLPWLKNTSF